MAQIKFYEHPFYEANEDAWEKYRVLYEGSHQKLVGSYEYLWPHELELSTESIEVDPATGAKEPSGVRIRRTRARRSRYFNMFEPVISNLIAMAFSKGIVFSPEVEKLFDTDIKDVDGNGTSLSDFITEKVAVAYFRDGMPVIFVDAPENQAVTKTEEKQNGFRPFMEVLDVLDVKDWQPAPLGAKGNYQWVRFEYCVIEDRASAQEEPQEIEYTKVLSIEDNKLVVRIYKETDDDKWELKTEVIKADWDVVPVVSIKSNESWVKDVAELQLVLFNYMSAHSNGLNTQAFQRIFIAADLGEKHRISISEYAISNVPVGSTIHEVQPIDPAALERAIDVTAEQIKQVAFNRQRSLSGSSKEAPGADTIAEMNVELIALLKRALEEIESLMNKAIKLYAMYKLGTTAGANFTGEVTFNKDIDTKAVEKRIEMFAVYRDEIRKVLSWRKAELKRAASEMGYSEEDTKVIIKEIDTLKIEQPLGPITMGSFGGGATQGSTPPPVANGQQETNKTSPGPTGKG
jgi:hypothetical protein